MSERHRCLTHGSLTEATAVRTLGFPCGHTQSFPFSLSPGPNRGRCLGVLAF